LNYLLEKTHERLRGGINVLPMLKEVATQWDDFFIDTGRQDTIECQKETMSINLVSADVTTKENRHTNATVETETYSRYPKVKEFMHWFEETYGGLIFRIAIVHLPADGVVHPHIDEGTYYQDKDRFHLVLSGYYDMIVNDKTEMFSAGELWWFNNNMMHDVKNASPMPRICIIFDVYNSKWQQ
tara:strand:+ start:1027 stop:1578 length:552 start_codon:yes stop_codon:yes gene_type:complete